MRTGVIQRMNGSNNVTWKVVSSVMAVIIFALASWWASYITAKITKIEDNTVLLLQTQAKHEIRIEKLERFFEGDFMHERSGR